MPLVDFVIRFARSGVMRSAGTIKADRFNGSKSSMRIDIVSKNFEKEADKSEVTVYKV